ncbi:hypothetical protein PENSPDRAFT_755352 [Peniophora sp. CONT]|nr:hypothetical protein PENSPDRAFT_755352 [Peniophora sp. CONT]
MSRNYERLPTSATSTEDLLELDELEEADEVASLHRQLARDPRFNPPAPAAWKRVALLLFVALMFFLTYWLRPAPPPHVRKPDVAYEELYDKYIAPPHRAPDADKAVPTLHIAKPGSRGL